MTTSLPPRVPPVVGTGAPDGGALSPGRHSTVLDGVRIAYEVRGSGPLLVAHSGGPGVGSGYLRMPEVERFATVVHVDPVGTGGSDRLPGGDCSTAAYARLSAALIDALGAGPAFFLGHSHGGTVALQLALDHPEVLRGVVVYSGRATTAGFVESATARVDAFVRRFPGNAVAARARAAWDDAVAQELPGAAADAEARADVARRLKPAYLGDFTATPALLQQLQDGTVVHVDPGRRPGSPWDVRARLPEICVPVAVFVGRHDVVCGPVSAAEIWQDVPDARWVPFEDSGHYAHLEEPERFAEEVRRFLSA